MNTIRTRSQSNVGKASSFSKQAIGALGNIKGKKSKKRSSDIGCTAKAHQRATRRNTRGVLNNITNIQVGTKRVKQGNLKKVDDNLLKQQSNLGSIEPGCRQDQLPVPITNAGSDNLVPHKSSLTSQDSEFVDLDISNEDIDAGSDNLDPMKDESDDEDEKRQGDVDEEVLRIDAGDIHNPQAVSEYIQDIMIYFRGVEGCRAPKPGYMDSQRDINSKMREILIDWLSEVHLKFKLRPETMYLTVNLIDRFLSLRAVSRTKLQLVGCTGMLIASKYEEIYAPEVRDFVYISDKAYTRDQILMMESIMLNTLKFNLTVPSALRFGQRFIKLVAGADDRFKMLVGYLMELTLQNYDFLGFLPSKIAASATYLALSMISKDRPGRPEWTSLLKTQTNYGEDKLRDCVRALHKLAAKNPEKYRAVRKKYSSRKFLEVAKIPVGPPPFL
jgi:cyclin B